MSRATTPMFPSRGSSRPTLSGREGSSRGSGPPTRSGRREGSSPPESPVSVPNTREERKEFAGYESIQMLERRAEQRIKMKAKMWAEHRRRLEAATAGRKRRLSHWIKKTANSPFAVDLLAEDERISEENKMREEEEQRERLELQQRKERAKNEIILRALEEASDLEALRKEKRAILLEEKRLKALLAVEKNILQAKQDRLVAVRAEKNRRQAKIGYRRQQYLDVLQDQISQEQRALRHKHGISEERQFIP